MELDGPGFLEYQSGATTYRVGHFSFFQVNRFLSDDLAREVTENEEGELALDLFAGVGLFSMPLARNVQPRGGRRIESGRGPRSGIECPRRAPESKSAPPMSRNSSAKYKGKPDLVLLDPPRAGLAPGDAKQLAAHLARAHYLRFLRAAHAGARSRRALTSGGYEFHGDSSLRSFSADISHGGGGSSPPKAVKQP